MANKFIVNMQIEDNDTDYLTADEMETVIIESLATSGISCFNVTCMPIKNEST